MTRYPPVTLERLDAALAALAKTIETHPGGVAYWPIFERLEREREDLISRTERLASARARTQPPCQPDST